MKLYKAYSFFIGVFSLLITGCQTYTRQNEKIRKELYAGKYTDALSQLEESSLATEKRNYALYRMEKGMLLYLGGNPNAASQAWREADQKLEALYTTSLSRTTMSFVVNDSMSDYEGEAHERILLPIFSSIAFLSHNDKMNSLVMVRRANEIINYLTDNEKTSAQYEVFSRYFAGMIREANKDWDNAIIEYQSSLNSIVKLTETKREMEAAKEEVARSLCSIATFRNRQDLLTSLKGRGFFCKPYEDLNTKSEVYILYESGISPVKVAKDYVIPVENTVVRVSFPEYKDLPYRSHYATIFANDRNVGRTILMENIGDSAKQALNNRRIKDFAKLATRATSKMIAAKKMGESSPLAGLAMTVFNTTSEVADTRSWTTLPDTLQIFRLPVAANQDTKITVVPEVGEPLHFNVKPLPGEKKFFHFRTF